jgi:hypothetical protein
MLPHDQTNATIAHQINRKRSISECAVYKWAVLRVTTAPMRLPMPPTTVAIKANSISGTPNTKLSAPVWEMYNSEATAARMPEMENASPITKLAWTPRYRAIWKSSADKEG